MIDIYIGPLGTSTTLTLATTSLDDTVQNDDLQSTTMTGLTSSLTTAMANNSSMHVHMANNYIDSLSTEELAIMEQKLNAKEKEFAVGTISIDKPKIYQKTFDV